MNTTANRLDRDPGAPIIADPPQETLNIGLQNMDAVADVVTTLGRVNASIINMRAERCLVRLTYSATEPVARRLPSLLRSIVPVTSVAVIPQS